LIVLKKNLKNGKERSLDIFISKTYLSSTVSHYAKNFINDLTNENWPEWILIYLQLRNVSH